MEGLAYNPAGRPNPPNESDQIAFPFSLPKKTVSKSKINDEEALKAVKRSGRPPGTKNKPRINSAPKRLETIASRLIQRDKGDTRVPPKVNTREQGDDEVFLPDPTSSPIASNQTPDIGQEGDDEAENDAETTIPPKQRRKTLELVKMFDELIQKRPSSENTYRTRALDRLRQEEAIYNYFPQELAEMRRASSETAKEIHKSLSKLPPLFSREEQSSDKGSTAEDTIEEFLRANSEKSGDESSSDISPEETEKNNNVEEAEVPITIEPVTPN
ncbi:Protein of unknown function [Cotesia congregata]|uniref:Uncharacterized protein n=1 Tax=Cotesia congregata TaxID=51543 RepID=A0A8J2MNZ0_COTCN|nr:Protein of unknown function [Cotesia congregata]